MRIAISIEPLSFSMQLFGFLVAMYFVNGAENA